MTVDARHFPVANHAWLKAHYAAYLAEIAPGLRPTPLTKWWRIPDRHPIDLVSESRRIGFALLQRPHPGQWELAEFYILPICRRLGLGQHAARSVFRNRPGFWTIGVVNQPAARSFWSRVVAGSEIRDLRKRGPLSEWQCRSYTFRI